MTHPELPFSGDHWYEPRSRDIVNRLEQEDWSEFCRQAAEAEVLAADYSPEAPETAEWVGEQIAELAFIFGNDYCKKYAHVFGLGYNQHHVRSGIVEAGEAIAINTDSASFQGVDMQYINGSWRTLLQFHIAEHTDALPSGMYYVPPSNKFLLELAIDLADDEDEDEFAEELTTAEVLSEEVTAAKAHIEHESFAELDPAEQRLILQDLIVEADNALEPSDCGHDVTIESTCHYIVYDNMPGFPPDFIDQQDIITENQRSVEGTIQGCNYPELAEIPVDKQLTREDFIYNGGAPCLIVRNDELQLTYYILPQYMGKIA